MLGAEERCLSLEERVGKKRRVLEPEDDVLLRSSSDPHRSADSQGAGA